MLTVPQRSKVESLLKYAETNISLKGRSFPDGEETWHLFANWLHIAKSLRHHYRSGHGEIANCYLSVDI